MKLDAELESKEFLAALQAYMADQKRTLTDALRFQGRLLAGTLIKLTPPKNRAQGRKAVERDLRKVFTPIVTRDLGNSASAWGTRIRSEAIRKALKKAASSRDTKAAYEILKNAGWDITPDQVVLFDPKFHQQKRRRGRVPGRDHVRKLILDGQRLTEYLKTTQSHVGRAKGGWAASAIALGGSVAGWIRNHAAAGAFEDNLGGLFDPSLVMTNRSEWASGGDDDRIVANAIRSRATQIQSSVARKQFDALRRSRL